MKNNLINSPINILIADDHQIFIDAIKPLLEKDKSVKVLAEANNGIEAYKKLMKHPEIDLVIADIGMPELDGMALTKRIKAEMPEKKVIILTTHDDPVIVHGIAMAEAEGYVTKNHPMAELLNAVKRIVTEQDATYYSSNIVEIIKKASPQAPKPIEIPLSDREIDVLALVCKEYNTKEIGEKLFISHHTVEAHRRSIREKLGTNNLVGTVKWVLANMPELLEDKKDENT